VLYYRKIREKRFKYELMEKRTPDILDKALIKAKANKDEGAIDAPTYYMIADKVAALKKLKFVQDAEQWRDKETYEWMVYKVAAEVGGEE
jgi:hypothetical protein